MPLVEVSWAMQEHPDKTERRAVEARLIQLHREVIGADLSRSSRESPRAAVPAMAVTGEGKGRNRATIREPLLMPRH